jgi:CheY-specific phosphatase CheX
MLTTEINLTELSSEAVTNVFSTMLAMELEPLNRLPDDPQLQGDKVVGSIGLGGEAAGVVYLHLTEPLARTVTSTMLGCDEADAGAAEINDVIGELCNMVGGSLKSRLCDAGFDCQLSLPSVLRGRDFQVQTPGLSAGRHVECAYGYRGHILQSVVAIKGGIESL